MKRGHTPPRLTNSPPTSQSPINPLMQKPSSPRPQSPALGVGTAQPMIDCDEMSPGYAAMLSKPTPQPELQPQPDPDSDPSRTQPGPSTGPRNTQIGPTIPGGPSASGDSGDSCYQRSPGSPFTLTPGSPGSSYTKFTIPPKLKERGPACTDSPSPPPAKIPSPPPTTMNPPTATHTPPPGIPNPPPGISEPPCISTPIPDNSGSSNSSPGIFDAPPGIPIPLVNVSTLGAPILPPCSSSSPSWSEQSMDDVDRLQERKMIGRQAAHCGRKQTGELIAYCETEYKTVENNYLRGCKWSPDGKVLISNGNDNVVRIFNMPDSVFNNTWDSSVEMASTRQVKESDLIYDFAWYPGMTSTNPDSCLFATTVRETPIHMFSALTGKVVCSFRAYDQMDEIIAAHSIGFTCDGAKLVAGFNRKLRIFDANRPGRDCVESSTIIKDKDTKTVSGQRGIVSCFAAHPTDPKVIAAGAFNGDVALYESSSGSFFCVFDGQPGGITHVTFSKDGRYLYAGGRKDPEINCFDVRNPEKVLFSLYRHVDTNQRMYFDIDRSSQYLMTGHHNGHVSTYDLQSQPVTNQLMPWPRLDPVSHFVAHRDTTNGLSINPCHPLVATCSGQRHFPESIFRDEDDSPEDISEINIEENSLKIWNLKLP